VDGCTSIILVFVPNKLIKYYAYYIIHVYILLLYKLFIEIVNINKLLGENILLRRNAFFFNFDITVLFFLTEVVLISTSRKLCCSFLLSSQMEASEDS